MTKLIYTALVFALAAVAGVIAAEAEYDYPREFASLFERFRVITPKEVQIDVALYGDDPWHTHARGLILKPILLKCVNGIPGRYIVMSYYGNENKTIRDMENVVDKLNSDDGFDPYELRGQILALKPTWREFHSFSTSAWTHYNGHSTKTTNVTDLIALLPKYLAEAEKEAGVTAFKNAKVYASSTRISPWVFAFEIAGADTKYFYTHDYDQITEVDEDWLAGTFNEKTYQLLGKVNENPTVFKANAAFWEGIRDSTDELEKKGGRFQIRESPELIDENVDGMIIEDVPDFNQYTYKNSKGGDCWVWSIVSPIVFHCQCEGIKFPSYKDPLPAFDDEEDWNTGTWKYGGHVYDRYAAAVIKRVGAGSWCLVARGGGITQPLRTTLKTTREAKSAWPGRRRWITACARAALTNMRYTSA